jgi:DNA-directed RNA polymerase specialized sigma24 family protein
LEAGAQARRPGDLRPQGAGQPVPVDGYSDEHREDAIVLWAATRRLPPRQRAVLVLRYYEDLSEAEIARVLGIPVGTVKSLARRGLATLRRSLDAPRGDTVSSKERA